MSKESKFQCADPWLLLSIIYARQQGNSDLSNIIGSGDIINHSIFSLEELQGGVSRLIKSGYVKKKNNEFFPTDKITTPYRKFSKRKNPIEKELEFIRVELNAPEWSSDYDPSKILNKKDTYDEINKEIVEKAYKEYVRKNMVKK